MSIFIEPIANELQPKIAPKHDKPLASQVEKMAEPVNKTERVPTVGAKIRIAQYNRSDLLI